MNNHQIRHMAQAINVTAFANAVCPVSLA